MTGGIWSVVIFLKNILIGMMISVYLLARKESFAKQSKKILYAILPETPYRRTLRAVAELGFTTHACKNCDYKYTDTYTAPIDHDWDEGKVASAPTLTETGILVQTCVNCGATVETSIPMLTSCDGGNGCPSKAYVDVPDESNWAHVGIDFVLKAGLFYGTSETTFDPDATMTRAMLVTVLYRLEGKPKPKIGRAHV